jgi:hypothetical protein
MKLQAGFHMEPTKQAKCNHLLGHVIWFTPRQNRPDPHELLSLSVYDLGGAKFWENVDHFEPFCFCPLCAKNISDLTSLISRILGPERVFTRSKKGNPSRSKTEPESQFSEKDLLAMASGLAEALRKRHQLKEKGTHPELQKVESQAQKIEKKGTHPDPRKSRSPSLGKLRKASPDSTQVGERKVQHNLQRNETLPASGSLAPIGPWTGRGKGGDRGAARPRPRAPRPRS